ncbi:branched-chain-amino-acid transaminase bat2, partial [Apophysomyces sp. BC1015]
MSPIDLAGIEKNYGGAVTLAFISDKHDVLTRVLSLAEILKIAGNGGGAQALQTVLNHGPMLRDRGFSQADI